MKEFSNLAKRRRQQLNPNRFQKQDDKGLFSFDPIRRQVFRWGLLAGATGGFFMLWQNSLFWPIVGVVAVVLISNHQIGKAARQIPRWQATVISFIGVFIAMFAVIILGTVILTYFQVTGTNG